MDIIRKIDDIRVKRGWTFYKLSKESGVAQQTLAKWMEGNTTPTLPALENICDAFGITLANLFADNDMVEVTKETKVVLDNWKYLTKEERESIKIIIENYVNRKN